MNELLKIQHLSISYSGSESQVISEFDFSMNKAEKVALCGPSGSGKSSIAKAILGLLPNQFISGKIEFKLGENEIVELTSKSVDWTKIRGNEISMIFQDPSASFNPVYTLGNQLTEAISLHQKGNNSESDQIILEALNSVGLSDVQRIKQSYPHELSGGQLQRVAIAMAIINNPRLLIADEPTTSLDVISEQEIIELLNGINRKHKIALLLISHDSSVVERLADRSINIENEDSHKSSKKGNTETPIKKESFDDRVNIIDVSNVDIEYSSQSNFWTGKSTKFKAVNNVDFSLKKGECLGLIGPSGSGKSTLVKALLNFIEPKAGQIDILDYNVQNELPKSFRRDVQVIFQNPSSSLDPTKTIEFSISEPLHSFNILKEDESKERVVELLEMVYLPKAYLKRKPHQLSLGEQQRVCIARALSVNPKVLICDEPVSSLDVGVKTEILNLIMNLRKEKDLSVILISHDLLTVKSYCNRIVLLNGGQIIEIAETSELFSNPKSKLAKELIRIAEL